jgi:hypothetical protein
MDKKVEVTTIVQPDEFEFARELENLLNDGWDLMHIGSGTGTNPVDDVPRLELVAVLQRRIKQQVSIESRLAVKGEPDIDDSIESTEPGYCGDGFTEEFDYGQD